MAWPSEDAPELNLHQALLVIQELRGEEQTIAFLRQEIQRLSVVAMLRPSKRALAAPAADADADRHLAMAADALAFYADDDNWDKPARARLSPVQRDKGTRARDALAAIAGDEETE